LLFFLTAVIVDIAAHMQPTMTYFYRRQVTMTTATPTIDPADDTRNVIDMFKGMNEDIIRGEQEKRRTKMVSIALNMTHDFNKSSVLRNHSAFTGGRFIFLNRPNDQIDTREGTKRWDKRGSVGVQNYNTVEHLAITHWRELFAALRADGYRIFAVDNTVGFDPKPVYRADLPEKSVFVYGEEGPGIPREIIEECDEMVYIPQQGVTPRSVNVAVAAGIVMYEYMRQHAPVE
jgi:tRNA G18 (ribose-2'-O)-methylase SpoU